MNINILIPILSNIILCMSIVQFNPFYSYNATLCIERPVYANQLLFYSTLFILEWFVVCIFAYTHCTYHIEEGA